jgi:hypothetical protein
MTVVVALGALGGTVMAQNSDGTTDPSGTPEADGGGIKAPPIDVLERVADKLGIDEGELRSAFDEAKAEIRDERLDAHIARMGEAGKITAEEGDELRAWFDDRPAVLDERGFGRRGHQDMGRGFGRGFRFGGHGFGGHDEPVDSTSRNGWVGPAR